MLIDRTCRCNQMHVGMIVQLATMGVQRRMGTHSAIQPRIPPGERGDGLPRCVEQQIVCHWLMSPEQVAQFRWHREGNRVVMHRQ